FLGEGGTALPLGVIERREHPRLCQLDRHLEEFPVTRRDHGVDRQAAREPEPQRYLVDLVEWLVPRLVPLAVFLLDRPLLVSHRLQGENALLALQSTLVDRRTEPLLDPDREAQGEQHR